MRKFLTAAVVIAASVSYAGAQSGATFVVNNTGDGGDSNPGNGVCAVSAGQCTLRAAIQESNAHPGHDTIQFAIGSGLQTIVLGSNLPAISQSATIDGWTQPGFAGSPRIFVNGNGKSGPGLTITAGNTTVRGLVIAGFSGDGVEMRTGDGNVFEGNYVGMGPDGVTPTANGGHGVVITNGSGGNRIGGPAQVQRNLISKNTAKGGGGGIILNGEGNNIVQGNFIGTDITGMVEHPNEARGIAVIGSSNNLIGGPNAGEGNLIAGNRATGVRMLGGSHNNTVQRNYIGVNRTLTGVLPNDRGVQIRDGNGNRVLDNIIMGNTYDGVLVWGGNNTLIQGNFIWYNGYGPIGDPHEAGFFGIWVATGTGNTILSNSIYANWHAGINLAIDGHTANDTGDGDSGANNLQNRPLLSSAERTAAGTSVSGVLNSTANGTFRVQFFASPSCDDIGNGEGHTFLGETSVITNGSGDASFAVALGAAPAVGWSVTATATDAGGNTSEFSNCTVLK
jgi:CSLREA domain-containing protein